MMGDMSSVDPIMGEGVSKQLLQAGVLVSRDREEYLLAGVIGGTLLTDSCRCFTTHGLEGVKKGLSLPVTTGKEGTGVSGMEGRILNSSSKFVRGCDSGDVISSVSFLAKGDFIVSTSILSQLFPDFNVWNRFGVFESGLYNIFEENISHEHAKSKLYYCLALYKQFLNIQKHIQFI